MVDLYRWSRESDASTWMVTYSETANQAQRYVLIQFPELISELASSELLPASTIFIPLPTSDLHYLIVRITTNGLIFELLRIARVPAQNGPGMKLAVDSRSPLPLKTLRQRRQDAKGKRKADLADSEKAKSAVLPVIEEPEAFG
jgi:hypothetical protein